MFWILSLIAKIIYFLIKVFKLGNGYTWPGHLVNKIYPKIWFSPTLQNFTNIILISGTNGKTTTSKIISHLLSQEGFSVISNVSGANLINGILSSLLLQSDFWGHIKADFAVFEVDELNLHLILQYISPRMLVLTNLSRDQLDRYGEVDTILNSWKDSLSGLSSYKCQLPTLLINVDFPKKEYLLQSYKGTILPFDSSSHYLNYTPLVGKFNALNLNAGVLAATQLGISPDKIPSLLSSFTPAFGRGEIISYKNKNFYLFLAKNPASFNNNLDVLSTENIPVDSLLFLLNDNIPDGRDVSWIYDIDPSLLQKLCLGKRIYIAGTRSLDMQIRLFYAGVEEVESILSLDGALLNVLTNKNLGDIAVLPNYSAMLELRKLLTGRNIL